LKDVSAFLFFQMDQVAVAKISKKKGLPKDILAKESVVAKTKILSSLMLID
jgi:hypothetical protein